MAYFLEGRPYQEKFINLLLPGNLLFQLHKPGKPSLQEYLQKLYPEQFHLLDPLLPIVNPITYCANVLFHNQSVY